jgi:hypothetical protein
MRLASLIDVEALWHVALYSLIAAVGLVTAYGTGLLAVDRMQRSRTIARAGWMLAAGVAGAVCVGVLVVGLWAMTQK